MSTENTERRRIRTLPKMKYKEMTFSIYHLIIAKSLNQQQKLFQELEKKLNKLDIDVLSCEEIDLEFEKFELSAEAEINRERFIEQIPKSVPFREQTGREFYKDVEILNLSDKFNSIFINIVLLTSTLLEALINLYVSIKCLETNNKELFEILESIDIEKKWKVAPRLFNEGYKLPLDIAPGQDLKALIKIRNAIVHHKSQVDNESEGDRLKGKSFDIEKYSEKVQNIKRFLALPKNLLAHLYQYEQSTELICLLSDSISLSNEDKQTILHPPNSES